MLFWNKVEKLYRARVFSRCDDTGRVKYFSHEEFAGLHAEEWNFKSRFGHTLVGHFYSYEGYCPDRLVLLEHGLGGGHRSYMKEIELLARHGYRVFAYDHTGCAASGGEGCGGLSQSLTDLDDCLTALKAANLTTDDLSIVGHSWGGYSAMNITSLHPAVKRIVALAGFISVSEMVKQSFPGPLAVYRRRVMELERKVNPGTADICAVETLGSTTAQVLVIHSKEDDTVSYRRHFRALQKALTNRENISFMTVEGHLHNPNYTRDAVAYKQQLYAAMARLPEIMTEDEKIAFRESFDWDRMTAQDPEVWGRIFDFLDK